MVTCKRLALSKKRKDLEESDYGLEFQRNMQQKLVKEEQIARRFHA